jgi:hypothetical protein
VLVPTLKTYKYGAGRGIASRYKSKIWSGKGHAGPEGSRGIALRFFNLDTEWGWVVNATPRPLYPLERDVVLNVQLHLYGK